MNIISVSQFLLIVMVGMAAGLPVEQQASDDVKEADTSPRFSRGAGNPRSTTIQQQFSDNEETDSEEALQQDEVTYNSPSRRSTSSCQISSYVVDLHELGLTNVIEPRYIDISKCSGNCNERRVINRLGTNHAKIMANNYNQQIHFGEPVTATVPCCVPTKYESVSLRMRSLDGTDIVTKTEKHLKATECGCRWS